MKRRRALTVGIVWMVASGMHAATWTHVTETEGLPSRQVQFVKAVGGEIWVGTLKGLAVFRNGKPQTVFKDEAVWDVLPVSGGELWIGTEEGIVHQHGAASERSLREESVGRIVLFGTNAVWAVCKRPNQSRLMEYVAGKWQPLKRFEGKKPTDLLVTRAGAVSVVLEANGMVTAVPGQAPEQWKHHQPGVNVTAFYEDKKGRIWCGTWDRGIMIFENGEWTRMLTDEDAVITTIREDGKGHIWAATNAHGVWEYDGANWVNHLNEEGNINLLETTPDGKVLVSSQSECSLRQWNGKGWDKIIDVPTMFIAVQADAKGKLWAGNILDGIYVQP